MTAFSNHTSTSVKKAPKHFGAIKIYGGVDETRTRGLLRDRQAF